MNTEPEETGEEQKNSDDADSQDKAVLEGIEDAESAEKVDSKFGLVLFYFSLAAVLIGLIAVSVTVEPIGRREEEQTKAEDDVDSGTESRFVNEVGTSDLPDAESLKESQKLRWNFSQEETFSYNFEQKTFASLSVEKPQEKQKIDTSQHGVLLIKSLGDNTAQMVLKDITVETEDMEGNNASNTLWRPIQITGMKQDSSLPEGKSEYESLLHIIFPLPEDALSVEESDDVPVRIPLNIMGNIIVLNGSMELELSRYVTVDKRTCAELTGTISIADQEIPSDLKGDFSCSAAGKSVFYFDVENRIFYSGNAAVNITFSGEFPSEEQGESQDMITVKLKSDNFIRIGLTQ